MSLDMSTTTHPRATRATPTDAHATLTTRQRSLAELAIEIIARDGYAALTMRALARAADMKLGALQYHFRTRAELFDALVSVIAQSYGRDFTLAESGDPEADLRTLLRSIYRDRAGEPLQGERLWPQLRALAKVEPLVKTLLDQLSAEYLAILEGACERAGLARPRVLALSLMSAIEGTALFVGSAEPWSTEAEAVFDTLVAQLVDAAPRAS